MDRRTGSTGDAPAAKPAAANLPVTVREIRAGDAAAALRVCIAAWEKGPGGLLPASARAPMADGAPIAAILRDAPERMLVADVGGHVLGVVASETGDEQLTDLWVEPRAWGRGLGSQLLAAFEQAAAARGCKRVTLETLIGNDRALAFFRRRGYRLVERFTTRDRDLHMMIEKLRLEKRLA